MNFDENLKLHYFWKNVRNTFFFHSLFFFHFKVFQNTNLKFMCFYIN